MRRIADEQPVIVVTHDIAQARQCDRVLFLHDGDGMGARLTNDGTPRNVFEDTSDSPAFRFAKVRKSGVGHRLRRLSDMVAQGRRLPGRSMPDRAGKESD